MYVIRRCVVVVWLQEVELIHTLEFGLRLYTIGNQADWKSLRQFRIYTVKLTKWRRDEYALCLLQP
jgi:hypothetical protein